MREFDPAFCNSPDHIWRPNRREFLFVGLVGSLGLTLGNVLKLQAQSVGAKAKAQSVINIFLPGGIAAQESFDLRLLATGKKLLFAPRRFMDGAQVICGCGRRVLAGALTVSCPSGGQCFPCPCARAALVPS